MADNQTNTAPAVLWVTLAYRDAPAAIDFLVKAFGFDERARYTGESENTVMHAELRWPGGGGVMLGSADSGSAVTMQPGSGSAYIVVDTPAEVDALFERAVQAGASVVREPTDEDYGGRDFVVQDPEGSYWSFGTYAGQ